MIRDLNSCPVASNRRRCTSFLMIAFAAAAAIGAASPAHATWTPDGVPVATLGNDQRSPVLVPDGTGGTIIVWWDDRVGLGIYAQRLDSDGNQQWGQNGILVAEVTWVTVDPLAVSDGIGGAYVIWSDSRDLSHSEDHLYAQRIDANGTPHWPAAGVKVCPNGGRQFFPAAVSDFRPQVGLNTPGLIVTWQDTRAGDVFNVYAQRMDMDGNRLWGDAGVGLSTSGTTQVPVITTDGTASQFFAAGAIVAWQTNGADIRANWVNASGVVQWGGNGLAVCTAAGAQLAPSIVTVGPRRVIIAWEDQRNVTSDIYAQKVDNGTVSWFGDGVIVCNSEQPQTVPKVAAAADGAFVAWVDIRDPADYDIYGQRVDLNGVPQWTPNGIPICGALGPQYGAEITHDGTGGAFVAWIDSRAGEDTNLYVQRVNENGGMEWQADGICASCAAGDQKAPEILLNNSFLFLAWEDTRQANGDDVYAGRLTAAGTVGVEELAPASEFGVRMLSANPHHGLARFAVELPAAARVAAEVIDPMGRRVRELGGDNLPAGHHELSWDWSDVSGALLPHGVYFLRVQAGARSNTIKLVHLP